MIVEKLAFYLKQQPILFTTKTQKIQRVFLSVFSVSFVVFAALNQNACCSVIWYHNIGNTQTGIGYLV